MTSCIHGCSSRSVDFEMGDEHLRPRRACAETLEQRGVWVVGVGGGLQHRRHEVAVEGAQQLVRVLVQLALDSHHGCGDPVDGGQRSLDLLGLEPCAAEVELMVDSAEELDHRRTATVATEARQVAGAIEAPPVGRIVTNASAVRSGSSR